LAHLPVLFYHFFIAYKQDLSGNPKNSVDSNRNTGYDNIGNVLSNETDLLLPPPLPPSMTAPLQTTSNQQALFNSDADNDRCSVVSDGAAWSTEMLNNNSDSDLESSNSPSKYTPYSTYSSSCSSHPPLNQSLLSDMANVSANNAANVANANTSQSATPFSHSVSSSSLLTGTNTTNTASISTTTNTSGLTTSISNQSSSNAPISTNNPASSAAALVVDLIVIKTDYFFKFMILTLI
jgi:hypothetical protein